MEYPPSAVEIYDILALANLCDLISRRPRECLLLCGTGLTIACMEPWDEANGPNVGSWVGLIRNGIWYCENNGIAIDGENLRASLVSEPRTDGLLTAANILWEAMLDDTIRAQWIEGAVGKLKISKQGEKVLRYIAVLQRAGVTIATTNYDNFLSEISGTNSALITSDTARTALVEPDRNTVVHFHGHYLTIGSLIFTSDQYDKHVQSQTTLFTEGSSFLNKHWITVGCGETLKDRNFGLLLSLVGKYLGAQSGRRNFFISKRNAMMNGIEPQRLTQLDFVEVGYEQHEHLPLLLEQLALSVDVRPFERFGPNCEVINQHFGTEGDYKPTWLDFETQAVPKVSNFDELERVLAQDRYVYVKAQAGMGKSVLGLQFAMSAYLAGRPVYWLNAIDGMDDFQEKLSLVAYDNALVIIDEAHTKVVAVRDVIDRIIPTHSDFQIVFLHTKGIGMQANQPSDIGYFSKTKEFSLIITSTFYRNSYNYISKRFGHSILIDEHRCNSWKEIFRNQVMIFAISLTQFFLDNSKDINSLDLDPKDAKAWLGQRYQLNDPAHKERVNLAFLGLVGAARDADMGWVPKFALPYPSTPFTERRSTLVLSMTRRSIDGELLRLSQANVLGDLVVELYASSAALKEARSHFDDSLAVLAARTMIRPENASKILGSMGKSLEDFQAASTKYLTELAVRMNGLAPRTLAFLFGHLQKLGTEQGKKNEANALSIILFEAVSSVWQMDSLAARGTLDGAGSLAYWAFKLGQDRDRPESKYRVQADMLRHAVVLRCDIDRDFTNPGFNIHNLSYLLRYMSEEDEVTEHFLKKIWTAKWLSYNLERAAQDVHLQDAIFQCCLYSCETAYLHIRHIQLHSVYKVMIARAVANYERSPPKDRARNFFYLMQNVGSASLVGTKLDQGLDDRLRNLDWEAHEREISQLDGIWNGDEVGSSDGSKPRIGNFQFKGWLGLRYCCEELEGSIRLQKVTIEKRIELWLERRREFPDEDGRPRRSGVISDSMIGWLRKNLENGQGKNECEVRDTGVRLRDISLAGLGQSRGRQR